MRGGDTASGGAPVRLKEQLDARGDVAVPDRALADTAAWLLSTAYRDQAGDWSSEAVSHAAVLRFGFPGILHGSMSTSLERDTQLFEQLVAQVPKSYVINRYGIVAGETATLRSSLAVWRSRLPTFRAPSRQAEHFG